MSGMLELGSSRYLNLTAEFIFLFFFKQIQTVKMAVSRLFTFEFQFEFWGVLPLLFYPLSVWRFFI